MKLFNRINTLLFSAVALSFAVASCDEGSADAGDSIITSFPTYSVTPEAGATNITVDEGDEDVITFKIALPEEQINDITLEVHAAASSTAEEGVDFEIANHEFEIPAFAGQDSVEIEIHILQDFISGEEDETIYLSFSTAAPTGIDLTQEILVATIVDSGLEPVPGTEIEFALSWAYTDESVEEEPCDFDFDFTIQTQGGAPYDDDLMGYDMATGDCPETGVVDLADMTDGEVYDLWAIHYDGFNDQFNKSGLSITLEFARENTTLEGEWTIDGLFDSRFPEYAFIIGTIQRSGDVVTMFDHEGTEVASGRINSRGTTPKSVHGGFTRP